MMRTLISILLLKLSCYSIADTSVQNFVRQHCYTNDVDTLLITKIITHESKTWFNGSVQPWPWTLNIDGVGYYYPDYETALTFAQKALANNAKKLGVGLGQIEWRFHKHRFKSVSQALLPSQNIKAVCEIIGEGRASGISNSFELAAYYHRPIRDEISFQYADKVFKVFK